MSVYEIAILWGSLAIVIALIAGFSAYSNGASYWFSLLLLLLGGGLVYYAYTQNGNAIDPRDIPIALYRMIGGLLN